MKKIDKELMFNLLFNIIETLLIFLIGKALNLPISNIIVVMLVFMISRGCFGKSLHFKAWYRCLVWSAVIMLSLFLILKIDLVLSILFSIYSAFIMTGKANIRDMYLWKNKNMPSKYQDVIDYIKYNEFDDMLISFEKKLKEKDNLEYLIYKYRFKEYKTFEEILDLLNYSIDNPKLVEHLDKITFALRLYCGI